MGKHSDYKKKASAECHYCDYCICRKGHRCGLFKKYAKKYKKDRGVRKEEYDD